MTFTTKMEFNNITPEQYIKIADTLNKEHGIPVDSSKLIGEIEQDNVNGSWNYDSQKQILTLIVKSGYLPIMVETVVKKAINDAK